MSQQQQAPMQPQPAHPGGSGAANGVSASEHDQQQEVPAGPALPRHLMQGPSRPSPDAGPSKKYKPPVGVVS